MTSLDNCPDAPDLDGRQVRLEPLRVAHAREMAPLLDDPQLHVFIGGEPLGDGELQQRYQRQVVGRSPDGSQRWLNWIVRRRNDGRAVGAVQATVVEQDGQLVAEVAWVMASAYQGHGYARDAAQTMVAWLRQQGVGGFVAHVHPQHGASAAIARAVELAPTSVVCDGEIRWES